MRLLSEKIKLHMVISQDLPQFTFTDRIWGIGEVKHSDSNGSPCNELSATDGYTENRGSSVFFMRLIGSQSCQMLTSLTSALCKKVNGYSTFSNVTLKNKELQIVCSSICFFFFFSLPHVKLRG